MTIRYTDESDNSGVLVADDVYYDKRDGKLRISQNAPDGCSYYLKMSEMEGRSTIDRLYRDGKLDLSHQVLKFDEDDETPEAEG